MKKRLFLLVTIIIAITHISNAQHFNYPFKMNDAEWKKFHSANERKAALQIPDSILSIIPTSELISICLEYPYLFDIKLYNDAKRGYKALCDDFNGFAELQKREDIIDELLDEYAMVPIRTKQISNKSDADKFNFGIACFVLRMALSNYVVSDKMNHLQHNRLNSLIAQDKNVVNEISEAPVGLRDFPVEFVETNELQAYSSYPSPSISYYTLSSDYNYTTRFTPLGSYVTAGVLVSLDYNQGQKTSIA